MFVLTKLPPTFNFETVEILKQLAKSHKALAELKGFSDVIPNKNIMINAAMINEAKDSSEIENIITTHDELYKAMSGAKEIGPPKEVINYRTAIGYGFEAIKVYGFLSTNMIVKIQSIIEEGDAGIRKVTGTVLKNEQTGEVVYTPPANYNEIISLMNNLELYINDDSTMDDLIKLAIIHYQFESIHPFYDGNGRTGRIINILYLILKGLLDYPILYLSKYINKHKSKYYQHLQSVRVNDDWENWVIYILKAIEETALNALKVLKEIDALIEKTKQKIIEILPQIYSKELMEVLFFEFYTKIVYVEKGLHVSRKTASTYLIKLEEIGVLSSEMVGRNKVYLNTGLYDIVRKADF